METLIGMYTILCNSFIDSFSIFFSTVGLLLKLFDLKPNEVSVKSVSAMNEHQNKKRKNKQDLPTQSKLNGNSVFILKRTTHGDMVRKTFFPYIFV